MKNVFTGVVLSQKMQKTVIVLVERRFRHPIYRKVIVRHKKIKAHNEKLQLAIGNKVKIMGVRPISKEKHFIVAEVLKEKNLKNTTVKIKETLNKSKAVPTGRQVKSPASVPTKSGLRRGKQKSKDK